MVNKMKKCSLHYQATQWKEKVQSDECGHQGEQLGKVIGREVYHTGVICVEHETPKYSLSRHHAVYRCGYLYAFD